MSPEVYCATSPQHVAQHQECRRYQRGEENLNVCKSMGPDEMHPGVLRELSDVAVRPFSMILEKLWQSGEVPGDWKKENIVPVFQKGRKDDPGNY